MLRKPNTPNTIIRRIGRNRVLFLEYKKEEVGHSGGYINENICSLCRIRYKYRAECALRGFPNPHRPCRRFDTDNLYYIPAILKKC